MKLILYRWNQEVPMLELVLPYLEKDQKRIFNEIIFSLYITMYRSTKIYIKYILNQQNAFYLMIEDEERQIYIAIFIQFPIVKLCDRSYDLHTYSSENYQEIEILTSKLKKKKIQKKKKNCICNVSIVVISTIFYIKILIFSIALNSNQ